MLRAEIKQGTIAWLVVGMLLTGPWALGQSSLTANVGLARTHSGGNVTVKVTYLNPKAVDGPQFHVSLETHSVALDRYDLKSLSLLRDDKGNTFLPDVAESKGGGHHREVTLRFSQPPSPSRSLELVIKDIAGIKERVFRWDL